MKQYSLECQVCKVKFNKIGGLHKHIKVHDLYLPEYYVKYFPRKNKLTGEPLPFHNIETYFSKDFVNRSQMNKWLNSVEKKEARDYIQDVILQRVYEKKRQYLPFHLELENCFLPKLDMIRENFGSYAEFSKETGFDILFDRPLVKDFFTTKLPEDLEIAIDTREQKPLSFKCQTKTNKLSFGDYTLMGDYYNYTFVDRKSSNDFASTMVGDNLERFKRELTMAKEMNSYMFVVVESTIPKIIAESKHFKKKSSIDYILKNMRDLTYEFDRHCQFVFTGKRANSEALIPRLLYFGQKVWRTDMQYFVDKKLCG